MSFQSFYALKLLILICASLPHTDNVKQSFLQEEIYNKRLVVSKLDKESKLLYNNVKSNLNLIDFHHVLNISLISNEKELEQIKFRHLSKLKNLIPNFTWDLVATSSHDPEKVIFNFSSYKLSSSDKDLLSKGHLTEFELLNRSTLVLLSMVEVP